MSSAIFIQLDDDQSTVIATRDVGAERQIRVKSPDMPGARWMRPNGKGTGYFSRYVLNGTAYIYCLKREVNQPARS